MERWILAAIVILQVFLLPYSPLSGLLDFTPISPIYLLAMVVISLTYFSSAEIAKRIFYRHERCATHIAGLLRRRLTVSILALWQRWGGSPFRINSRSSTTIWPIPVKISGTFPARWALSTVFGVWRAR